MTFYERRDGRGCIYVVVSLPHRVSDISLSFSLTHGRENVIYRFQMVGCCLVVYVSIHEDIQLTFLPLSLASRVSLLLLKLTLGKPIFLDY